MSGDAYEPDLLPESKPEPEPEGGPWLRAKAEPRPRLIVTGCVYHQAPGMEPTAVGAPFSRELASDEQPFQRHFKATPQWKPLETGWVPRPGMMVLENRGSLLVVLATGGDDPHWCIPPGESFRGSPSFPFAVSIRCPEGESKCILTLFSE